MSVVAMGEHDVRVGASLQPLELVFDISGHVREVALAKLVQLDVLLAGCGQERGRSTPGFAARTPVAEKTTQVDLVPGVLLQELKEGAAATDLDVVAGARRSRARRAWPLVAAEPKPHTWPQTALSSTWSRGTVTSGATA